jgi:hypothetical protein
VLARNGSEPSSVRTLSAVIVLLALEWLNFFSIKSGGSAWVQTNLLPHPSSFRNKKIVVAVVISHFHLPKRWMAEVSPVAVASFVQYADFQEAQEALAPVYDSGLNL